MRVEIDEAIVALIDREITCTEAPEGTCAIASEFQDLANQAFDSSTPENPQHFVSFLDIGQDALLARLHLIRSAKKSINLQTFIWMGDEVGRLMFGELLQAARRGVEVRLIVDQFSMTEDPEVLAKAATAHANLKIRFYNPILSRGKATPLSVSIGGLLSFRKANQRMHNKVFIVDERIGIIGGRNIENKYYDYDTGSNFKDRDVIIMGPVVAKITEFFELYWSHDVAKDALSLVDIGGEALRLSKVDSPLVKEKPDLSLFSDINELANEHSICTKRPACKPYQAGRVQFTSDLPGKPTSSNRKDYTDASTTLSNVFKSAQDSLTIQTPYLVTSKRAEKNVKNMLRKNPDLKITISTNSLASTDAFMVYAISMKNKRTYLKKLKFNIYELQPHPGDAVKFIPRYNKLISDSSQTVGDDSSENNGHMPIVLQRGPRFGLHAKSFVVDSKIAIIGSHNFDPRGVTMSTECAVIIWDNEIARALEQNILRDTEPQNSWVIAKLEKVPFISYFGEIIGSISQMIPVFDIWPFRYSSSYQLKEGMEPLPINHPEFYKHYENVGQFPAVDMPSEGIKTRLIKTFGGFTAPLM
jgi:phosphatidylserine/phosphatidylglycerophosphate/cardiolipin synthase-like enzyme